MAKPIMAAPLIADTILPVFDDVAFTEVNKSFGEVSKSLITLIYLILKFSNGISILFIQYLCRIISIVNRLLSRDFLW